MYDNSIYEYIVSFIFDLVCLFDFCGKLSELGNVCPENVHHIMNDMSFDDGADC